MADLENIQFRGLNLEHLGPAFEVENKIPLNPKSLFEGAESYFAPSLWKSQVPDPSKSFYTYIEYKSHPFDTDYLRWQAHRYASNGPIRLTGFEGYYVGSGLTNKEIVDDIYRRGLAIIKSMPRELFRHVENFLEGKNVTFQALLAVDLEMRTLLALYRGLRSGNPEAVNYRNSLPIFTGQDIQYKSDCQIYSVPRLANQEVFASALSTEPDIGTPYWLMSKIGIAGHPIVRASISSIDPSIKRELTFKPWRHIS